jgi:threonine-phosphate decarboxylase
LNAIRAIRKGLWAIRHYPDPEAHELRQLLSTRYRLPPSHVLISNGADELIQLIPRALSIRHALVLGPTFSNYERALAHEGSRITPVLAHRTEGYRVPLDRAIHALDCARGQEPIDTVFLCHPNSPTGQLAPQNDLRALIETVGRRGLRMVVDESFIDFCEDHSVMDAVANHPHLILLRSFTKFYGIPGLRIGYLVASPDLVDRVRHGQPSWPVNALAQIAAAATLKDKQYKKRTLSLIADERARLTEGLSALPGLHIFPSVANFLLLELPSTTSASHLAERLRTVGILVRDCSPLPGLTPHTLRVAVKTAVENQRLVRAIEHAMRE